MDEARRPAKDPTNAEYEFALRNYLDLFNSNSNFFNFFIAQNGVLEWFGRTIKGNTKIQEFFRYEVCPQYDHLLFETAKRCEPFECKPTHLETRKYPTKTDMTINRNLTDSSFAGEKTVSDTHTPITAYDAKIDIKARCGSITPPSTAKRFKHDEEHDHDRSYPPLLNIDDYFDRKETSVNSVSRDVSSFFKDSDDSTVKPSKNSSTEYSELRYFESTGILRSCTHPEHRHFRDSNALNGNGTWDRETKIKVSYRIRLHDNDIEFALIIYQNIHPYSSITKRNLMMEFNEAATPERLAVSQNSIPRNTPTSQQMKRKIGRRLMLL